MIALWLQFGERGSGVSDGGCASVGEGIGPRAASGGEDEAEQALRLLQVSTLRLLRLQVPGGVSPTFSPATTHPPRSNLPPATLSHAESDDGMSGLSPSLHSGLASS